MGDRKHYLDWLRVIAFFLLILFHVGMLYVTWSYNLKSPRLSPQLELYMNLLSPWRLALLFFIAGVASRFLLAKLGPAGFAGDRLLRLLPVLLVGMFITNPPQVYVEVLSKNVFDRSYWDFWIGPYLNNGYAPYRMTPTWDHLWFLLYLLVYALGLAALLTIRRAPARQIAVAWLVVVPALWLGVSNVIVTEFQPVTHAFFNDWANHLRWIGIYAAGVVCASQPGFWEALRLHRRRSAVAALALLVVHVASQMRDAGPVWDAILYDLAAAAYGWSVILLLCGYAAEYFDKRTATLSYLNEAILPVYVFHQPVMLVFAYLLFPLGLPVALEVALLVAVTGAGSFLGYELFARRTAVLRFLFGLRQLSAKRG